MEDEITLNTKTTLTVEELISILQTVENKALPVFIYDTQSCEPVGFYAEDIDLGISDRVDINF